MGDLIARNRDICVAVSDIASGHGDSHGGIVRVQQSPILRMGDKGKYPFCSVGENIPWFVSEGHPGVRSMRRPVSSHLCETAGPNGFGRLHVTSAHEVYIGGPTVTMIQAARINARNRIKRAIESVLRWNDDDAARFRRWFGDDSEATRATVLENLAHMDDKIGRSDFEIGPKRGNKVAHVYPLENTIYLDEAFWTEPMRSDPSDPDSKFNTQSGSVVHESSHFTEGAHTDDNRYGVEDCKELAQKSPELAQKNADSYQYFTEDE
ncbi:MAG: M35 family metallopeptidase [Polyangiaceae bacterium]